MAEHADISYLKQDHIGKVVASGLAELYKEKPAFPIDYLAKWLFNYSKTKENEEAIAQKQARDNKLKEQHQEKLKDIAEKNVQKAQEQEQINREELAFRDEIENYEYHEELLLKFLPEGIFSRKNLTGVYIALNEYPIITPAPEAVDDYGAHLDINKTPVLQYVGGDEASRNLLLNKELPNEKGVTYDLLKPKEVAEAGEADENDEVDVDAKKENWVFVQDCVTEPRMHYFQIPRLGSYLAIPIFINSYLMETFFDDALKKTKEYKEACKKLEEDKTNAENEFQSRIEEARANGAGDEIEAINQEWEEKMKEFEPIEEPVFDAEEKKYILCCDTLGKDQEISYDDRVWINSIAQHFGRSWEQKELSYLKTDVENYINYENEANFEENLARFQDHEERELNIKSKEIEDMGEKQGLFKSDEIKLECAREHLMEEGIRKQITDMKNYRLIKFPKILQNCFLLLGMKTEEFNEPKTHMLNWKKIRNTLINDELIDKLLAYEYTGPKETEVPNYSYINRIKERLSKISQDDVNYYNLGLGRLFYYLSLVVSLRIQNIYIRRDQREADRKERENKIEEDRLRSEKFENDMAIRREEMAEEEGFDEEQEKIDWENNNPPIEIPPEVVDELDLDLEEEPVE